MLKHLTLSALVFLVLGCGNTPVEPDEEALVPSWCSPYAVVLAGQWEHVEERSGHLLESHLVLTPKDNLCTFAYRLQTYTYLGDPHVRTKIFESQGEIIVTQAQEAGGVINMLIESRRLYRYHLNSKGQETEDQSDQVHAVSEVKVWDDALLLWRAQYARVLE